MGSSGSKSPRTYYITTVHVPVTEEGYPPPCPPRDRKDDIYRPEDCRHIDDKARKAPQSVAKSYDTLIAHVTEGARNDVEKVRGIFAWMSAQRIYDQDYSGVKDGNTPEGYMKTIKQGNGTLPGFFALLCRAADLPCVLVRGHAKGTAYEAGMQNVSNMESVWNSVYLDGQWRLVNPDWAFCGMKGFNTGSWTKVVENGKSAREKERESSGELVYDCDEDWFLTDPDQFIYSCRAMETEWQLLEDPWTMEKFLNTPFLTMDYISSGLKLVSENTAVLKCKKACNLNFEHSGTSNPRIAYRLYFDEKKSEDRLPSDLKIERYIIERVDQTHVGLQVRFPVRGIYKLEIFREDGKCIAVFLLENLEVAENVQPYPINPKGGFGYGHAAEDAGLREPSQVEGIVVAKPGEKIRFQFSTTRKLDIHALLVHKDMTPSELADHVKQEELGYEVIIMVDVPRHVQNPEYALRVNVRPEGSHAEYENVVNYLLTQGVDEEEGKKSSDSGSKVMTITEDDDEEHQVETSEEAEHEEQAETKEQEQDQVSGTTTEDGDKDSQETKSEQPDPEDPAKTGEHEQASTPTTSERDTNTPDTANQQDANTDTASQQDANILDTANQQDADIPDTASQQDANISDTASQQDANTDTASQQDANTPDTASQQDADTPDTANQQDADTPDTASQRTEESRVSRDHRHGSEAFRDAEKLMETLKPLLKFDLPDTQILTPRSVHTHNHTHKHNHKHTHTHYHPPFIL